MTTQCTSLQNADQMTNMAFSEPCYRDLDNCWASMWFLGGYVECKVAWIFKDVVQEFCLNILKAFAVATDKYPCSCNQNSTDITYRIINRIRIGGLNILCPRPSTQITIYHTGWEVEELHKLALVSVDCCNASIYAFHFSQKRTITFTCLQ